MSDLRKEKDHIITLVLKDIENLINSGPDFCIGQSVQHHVENNLEITEENVAAILDIGIQKYNSFVNQQAERITFSDNLNSLYVASAFKLAREVLIEDITQEISENYSVSIQKIPRQAATL